MRYRKFSISGLEEQKWHLFESNEATHDFFESLTLSGAVSGKPNLSH